jgi:serine/threonine protein kinase
LTGDDWRRVVKLFQTAADMEPEEQAAYLDRVCGQEVNPSVRREVEVLLASRGGRRTTRRRRSRLEETRAVIGKYELLEYLGGGMSDVYRAVDTEAGRVVAVKLLRETDRADEEMRLRLLREVHMLESLQHENIVRVFSSGAHEGRLYLVMEYLEGEDLASAIAGNRTGTIRQRLNVARQIADALGYVHSHGIVHRDIKPANVFLERSGRVKLMDFGIARTASSGLTMVGSVMGTPQYMAPEQLKGLKVTHAADIYAFGILLYELLTGERPYQGENMARILQRITTEDLPLEPLLEAGAPRHIAATIQRATAKEAKDRFGSFEELLQAMGPLPKLAPAAPEPSPTSFTGAARAGTPRRWLWVLAAAAAALVVSVALLVRASRPIETSIPKAQSTASPQQSVTETLRRYESAYRTRSVEQVTALWPSLDGPEQARVRALFGAAVTVQLELRPVGEVRVAGAAAAVVCLRKLEFTDRQGRRQTTEDQVTVRLRQSPNGWVIESMQ